MLTEAGDLFVFDCIAEHAGRQPDKLAMIDLLTGRRQTFGQMHANVARVAGHLRALGIEKGDRVGLFMMNSDRFLEVMYACWRLGAVCTTLNFRLTAPELSYMITDSGCKVVVFDGELDEVTSELRAMVPLDHWLRVDVLEEAFVREPLGEPVWQQESLREEDLCMIMYSSGTTGTPKGVTFNFGQFHFVSTGSLGFAQTSPNMVNLVTMPLFHIGGLMIYTAVAVSLGGTVIIARTFDPAQVLHLIDDADLGITHYLGVPAMFKAMSDLPQFKDSDFSRLVTVACGAESVPEALLHTLHERGFPVREGYAMTETCAICLMLDPKDVPGKIGSAGKPVRHCAVQLVRPDGTVADHGELGEIWIRGKNITPGYWNRPDANDSSFVGGWFKSGDIGRRDEEGYYYIEDRVKDMYISGGENVYPAEVENLLYELAQIREVAVIGVPHAKWGETGCVVASLQPAATLSLEEVLAHCDGRLARFKQPTRLELVEALPRNATGKVLKFELRSRFSS